MTLPMLEALRTETVRLHLSMHAESGSDLEAHAPCRYRLAPETFYLVKVVATNLSRESSTGSHPAKDIILTNLRIVDHPLTLTLDVNAEPADHIIYEGVLSNVPLGHLNGGESAHTEFSVSFAARGLFELAANAGIWGSIGEGSKVGHGVLKVDIQ